MKLFDVTNMRNPVPVALQARVALANAQRLYLARTYAYVAAKDEGLVILDVTRPASAEDLPAGDTSAARMNDVEDVMVGSTNASLFAYVADGVNGMKVLQLTSPDSQPNFYGFSPAPKPELIAFAKTKGPAIALSKGLDRDRAVDETGGQMAVFGRLGSRPFTREEMEKLFLTGGGSSVEGQRRARHDRMGRQLRRAVEISGKVGAEGASILRLAYSFLVRLNGFRCVSIT